MNRYDDIYEFDDKPKRKRDEDPTTWTDAWKAIGIFLVIYLVLTGITWVAQFTLYGDLSKKYFDITLSANPVQQPEIIDSYFNAFQNPAPLFLALYFVLATILVVVALFIVYGLIHVFATKVQGGEGTLRGLIVRANWWTIGVLVINSLFSSIFNYFMMSNVVNRFEGVNIVASSAALTEYSNFIISESTGMYVTVLIAWLVWCVNVGLVTAKNYHIAKSKGCLAMVLTNVALIAMYCGCTFAIGFGLATVMMSA